MLEIKNLKVSVEEKEIIKGLNIKIKKGETHVLMGPNGSGKSTLAMALMGHPGYGITDGSISFDGEDLLEMDATERSLAGLFLSFQYPSEVSGVTISSFLRMIYNKRQEKPVSPAKFRKILKEKMDVLSIDPEFSNRYINEGFSGGEKKRMEILQMLILEPNLALLDETDSGLDIDALKTVSKGVNLLKEKNDMPVFLITHYTRILQYIKPDFVHILKDGVITRSGDEKLAHELEAKGYAPFGDSEGDENKNVDSKNTKKDKVKATKEVKFSKEK